MRGNHSLWFRQDYTPPPCLTPEQLQRVSTVNVCLKEGTKTWHEVRSGDMLLGYVTTRSAGQSFRGPDHDFWVPVNQDWHHDEPQHARAILALLDHIEHEMTTGSEACL